MDEIQEVTLTLTLPAETFRQVSSMAAERNQPLSALVAQLLTRALAQENAYQAAKASHEVILTRGYNLGTHGNIRPSRDSLHED